MISARAERELQAADRGRKFLDSVRHERLAGVPIMRTIERAQSATADLEQTLLGALLSNPAALSRCGDLRVEHFERPDHRLILDAIRDGLDDTGAADVLTVGERLRRNGADDGLIAYIAAVAQSAPSAANVAHYAELVREAATRRALAALGADLAARAGAPDADLGALRREVEGRLAEIKLDGGHEWGNALDLAALATREPEPPCEIMPGLPSGYATLSAGHGGAGKSTIELTRAICIAAGVPFFGLPVERRRVLYLSCEDRESVLHWRLSRACAFLGVDLAGLRDWLRVVDLVGADSIFWERDPRTGYTLTPAFDRLSALVRDAQAELLFVDGTADTFGGNENARGEVKRYVNALVGLIPPERGAVVLIAHVNKSAALGGATPEGYSGSTGWHNAARARWYLYPETSGDGEGRTGALILELQKANFGESDVQIRFQWDQRAHLFVGETVPDAMLIDRKDQERSERAGVLAAFKSCDAAGLIVPAAMQGPRTAFHVLSVRPEFPETLRDGRPGSRRFWRIVEALRHIRHVDELQYRRTNGHKGSQLRLTAEGERHIAT